MISVLLLTGLVTGLCGLTRRFLNQAQRADRSCLGGRVELTALWNHGAAFGLSIPRPVLTAGAAVGMLGLLLHPRASRLGRGLVLGGGLSNWLERLLQGKVYDYLRFPKAPGRLKKYVYNLADFAVFFGLTALLLPRKKSR